MSNRRAGDSAAARGRAGRRGVAGAALALLAASWTGAPGDVRPETIVLKSGEEIEGSVIDATRNTVIVRRSIGGMRQMRIRDIDEVRVDLAQGKQVVGQFLSWADGVYQLRSGGELVWVSEVATTSRRPSERAAGQPPRQSPTPEEEPTVALATAPAASTAQETAADRAAPARAPTVAPKLRDQDRSRATDEEPSPAAGEEQGQAVAAEQSPAAREERSRATDEKPSPATGEEQSLAAVDEKQAPATGETQSLAVKASVEPAQPGAENMVFHVELSRPAEQIYGTVDDTAKAGTDYEPSKA
jgi:hypothetical protein